MLYALLCLVPLGLQHLAPHSRLGNEYPTTETSQRQQQLDLVEIIRQNIECSRRIDTSSQEQVEAVGQQ